MFARAWRGRRRGWWSAQLFVLGRRIRVRVVCASMSANCERRQRLEFRGRVRAAAGHGQRHRENLPVQLSFAPASLKTVQRWWQAKMMVRARHAAEDALNFHTWVLVSSREHLSCIRLSLPIPLKALFKSLSAQYLTERSLSRKGSCMAKLHQTAPRLHVFSYPLDLPGVLCPYTMLGSSHARRDGKIDNPGSIQMLG